MKIKLFTILTLVMIFFTKLVALQFRKMSNLLISTLTRRKKASLIFYLYR